MTQYFDLHVFHSRKDGFSVPIKMENPNVDEAHTDDTIIEFAVKENLIDAEDADYVDSIEEIDEAEYNQMKGI
jgi:hypothetical protein